MDPTLLLQAPGFITGLMSLFGAGQQRDPVGELDRTYDMLMRRFGPEAISGQANQMYRLLQGSPMFQSAMNNLVVGGQQSQNMLTRNLAGAGMAGSGIGQIQRAMAPSVMGGQVANLRSQTYGQGLDAIMQLLPHIMRSGMGVQGRAPRGMGALNFAQGIENTDWSWALPLLRSMQRQPGTNVPRMGQPGYPGPTEQIGQMPVYTPPPLAPRRRTFGPEEY